MSDSLFRTGDRGVKTLNPFFPVPGALSNRARSIASAPAAGGPEQPMIGPPLVTLDWAFNAVEAQRIVELCEQFDVIDATIEEGSAPRQLNKAIRDSLIRVVPRDAPDSRWIFSRLDSMGSLINEKYYGFGLDGYDFFQYAEYRAAGHFATHMDYPMGRPGPVRKLSISLTLNDDYEGGDFQIQTGREPQVVRQAAGRLIAFPSFILHSVSPVTKGVRKSLVVWVTGPAFT
jgi:PKHD-type hydroxylase